MSHYVEAVLTFTSITCITVCGLYILTGLTGMFSLGQASFMALGAYAAAVLGKMYAWPFLPCLLVGMVLSVAMGFLCGYPIMRLRKEYLALVTLCYGEAVVALLNQSNVTGGALGMSDIPKHTTLIVALLFLAVCIFFTRNFRHSKFGRMAIAVKSDELASQSMGINMSAVKMRSFLCAAGLAGLAGGLYAFYLQYVDPSLFGWRKSGEWVSWVFFGGVNSLTGSIVATFGLSAISQFFSRFADYQVLIYSAMVLLVLNFKPNGVFGYWEISDLFLTRDKRKSRLMAEAAAREGALKK